MRYLASILVASTLAASAACGSDTPAATSQASTIAPAAQAAEGYTAGSDVTSHAAIGADAEAIRDLLAVAKEGGKVDWAGVEETFTKGGASKKGDGSLRTLASLAKEHQAATAVTEAIAGGGSDAVRAQHVDKGISVILADKVLGELEAAEAKVEAKELDSKTGAPHNVDEAWAFFTAQGQGPASTADKRAKDFELTGKVKEPILEALTKAQAAAATGDKAGFESASAQVRAGLDYVFYLATYKYLDHGQDEVKQAEGAAFYRGIAERVRAAAPEADSAIQAALRDGNAATGRTALHHADVLKALGITDETRVDK